MHNLFYFTDIHGIYILYDAIIKWCFEQDSDCVIVYGGDACDRGRDGYLIMKGLLENSQVVYLKGNHEDMFVKSARELQEKREYLLHANETDIYAFLLNNVDNKHFTDTNLYILNGGMDTLLAWIKDGMSEDFVNRIDKLPLTFTYNNLDFCHAGARYDIYERVATGESKQGKDAIDLLWDRKLIGLGWETGRVCIFGHTPTTLLPRGIYGPDNRTSHIHPCAWQDHMGAKNKRGGWKIDMDAGTAWTNRAFVLDCLNMQVYGFEMADNIIIKNLDPYKII